MKKIIAVVAAIVALIIVAILVAFFANKKAEAPKTDVTPEATPVVIYITPEPTTAPVEEAIEEPAEESTFVLDEVEFFEVVENNGINAVHIFGDEDKVVAEAMNWDWNTWAWLLQAEYENSSVWQHVSVCEAVADGSYMETNASKALVDFYAANGGMDIIRANGQFVSTKVGELVNVDRKSTSVKGISDNAANDYFTQVDSRWVLVETHVSDMVFANANVEGTLKKDAGFVRYDRLGESIGLQRVAEGEFRVVIYTTAGTAAKVEAPKQASRPVVGPTTKPTVEPTMQPTVEPTVKPTEAPTVKPTVKPTEAPTVKPTVKPTEAPTVKPTEKPTVAPTVEPTVKPTQAPTVKPTVKPTTKPTGTPAHEPEATLPPKQGYVSRDEQETTPAHEVEPTLPPKQGTVTRAEQDKATTAPTVKPTQAPTVKPTQAPAHSNGIVLPETGNTNSGKTTQKPAEVAPAHQEEQAPPKMGGITF